jgi:hypothetical protein
MGTRSSGGAKDAKMVYRIVWVEEHPHGTYTKSTKAYSKHGMESKVAYLKNRLKKGSDPNDRKWRWDQPVLSYTVDQCPLNWERIEEVTE